MAGISFHDYRQPSVGPIMDDMYYLANIELVSTNVLKVGVAIIDIARILERHRGRQDPEDEELITITRFHCP
jgi:hypothetical protein